MADINKKNVKLKQQDLLGYFGRKTGKFQLNVYLKLNCRFVVMDVANGTESIETKTKTYNFVVTDVLDKNTIGPEETPSIPRIHTTATASTSTSSTTSAKVCEAEVDVVAEPEPSTSAVSNTNIINVDVELAANGKQFYLLLFVFKLVLLTSNKSYLQ